MLRLARWIAVVRGQLSCRLLEAAMPRLSLDHLGILLPGGASESSKDADYLWLAAPKKRVSKARKRMRTANWALKPIVHVHECPICGGRRLAHRLWRCCIEVAVSTTREAKAKAEVSNPRRLEQPRGG